MRNKAFTLVELLAVMVILAIILAIAVPGIVGIINSATESAFKSDAQMVLKQLDYSKLEDDAFNITEVTEQNLSDYGLSSTNYSSLVVSIVDGEPYILIIGKGKWDGLKACGTIRQILVVPASDTTTCGSSSSDYVASEGVNAPRLAKGMIPVMWNGTNWVKADTTNGNATYEWYGYTDKKWANAVTVTNETNRNTYLNATVGTVIPMTEINAFWVWIPRYAYQIASGYHTNTAGTINIKFLMDNTNTAADETPIVVSNASQSNYVLHPAFTFGEEELTGIWISKFEMVTIYDSGTSTSSLYSKPNISSNTHGDIYDLFMDSRFFEYSSDYGWDIVEPLSESQADLDDYYNNFIGGQGAYPRDTNDVNVHMMKNSEWGVAAYLSKSIYGINGNIGINNASVDGYHMTGCGAPAGSLLSTTCNAYNTANGMLASTTGNVYGIYDMSGGEDEYVMGNYNGEEGAISGLLSFINTKYVDTYTAYNNTKYGDAVYETSSSSGGTNSWYGDYAQMTDVSYPWFIRGGDAGYASSAGIFDFSSADGSSSHEFSELSWRTVIAVGEGL